MDVRVLKLVSGEWVIAECSAVMPDSVEVCLKNPCVIGVTPEGIAFGPLSPFSDNKEVCIRREHVLFIDTPNVELRNGYAGQFGGITLPPAGLDLNT